ncbi:MAG: DUF4388 domain-containing protein [Myxococcales bacterium]|nr:DUF4388 domain-containing protein [Myxococcales bacterium]
MSAQPDVRSGATGVLLVADGNAGRARRLAAALEGEVERVEVADNGVVAIERALALAPSLLVAAHGLPLVDAPRLAEIVASNPRTSSTRFLFLGEPERSSFQPGVGDEQVPATLRPLDVADVAREMLARQRRAQQFAVAAGSGHASSGSLEELALADALRMLNEGAKSGRLELSHDDLGGERHAGSVDVERGEIVGARTGRATGEKALFRMLLWDAGSFRFGPRGTPGEAMRMRMPTRQLLAEGLRQASEWKRLSTQLPPLDSRIHLRVEPADLPSGVHPLTQEVLVLLEAQERVGDVVDHASFPDYQVLRTLRTLEERGIVAIGRSACEPRPGPREGLFGEPQVRRLREWIRDAQGHPSTPRPARLVVAASDASGLPDLANLLRPIPGVALAPAMEAGRVARDAIAPLGTVRIDERHAIELVHVPSAPRFAPLWARAAHGALGVVFLLSGAVGEAATRLAPMVRAVHALPRPRVFHAALLGKGERPSPDELRENLSLIDEGSLFLIPLEPSKEPSTLLARLFARIVP